MGIQKEVEYLRKLARHTAYRSKEQVPSLRLAVACGINNNSTEAYYTYDVGGLCRYAQAGGQRIYIIEPLGGALNREWLGLDTKYGRFKVLDSVTTRGYSLKNAIDRVKIRMELYL